MKPLLSILAFPLVLGGCVDVIVRSSSGPSSRGGSTIVGTGKPVTETRAAQQAATIAVSGGIRVTVRKGAPRLVVSAQKEILGLLRSEFKGGRLTVWVSGNSSTSEPIRVWYTGPSVTSLEGSGATQFDATGLGGETSSVRLSGSSRATATGTTTTLKVEASGAAEANLSGFRTQDADVRASGASQVRVWAERSLTAEASGASRIRYRTPVSGSVRTDATGASQIGTE